MEHEMRHFVAMCLLGLSTTALAEDVAEINKKAPDFTATGIDGKTFKLSDKIGKDNKNVVLLFSRANW